MARKLARAGGISRGVASGLAGFMDFRRAFEDAQRKMKWEKEKVAETARLERQKLAMGAGYQPEDMGRFLATGQGGEWSKLEVTGMGATGTAPEGYEASYSINPEGKVTTTLKPGGLPSESGGKLTMINQAISDLDEVEKVLFPRKGKFAKGIATLANLPGGSMPGIPTTWGYGSEDTREKVRMVTSKMTNALEAKLRIETGAAATQEEFNRIWARFGITAFDSIKTAKDKIRRLKEFMQNAKITVDPTGKFTYKGKGTEGLNISDNKSNLYNKYGLE